MLEAYRRMQANGAIGPMMKVGTDGKTVIYDPAGEQPGTLVPRVLTEYPKAVRRVRRHEDGTEEIITLVAHSRADELKIMSDTADLEQPLSPIEKERNQLAEDLATERKMSARLAEQLQNLAAKVDAMQAGQAKAAPAAPSAGERMKAAGAAATK